MGSHPALALGTADCPQSHHASIALAPPGCPAGQRRSVLSCPGCFDRPAVFKTPFFCLLESCGKTQPAEISSVPGWTGASFSVLDRRQAGKPRAGAELGDHEPSCPSAAALGPTRAGRCCRSFLPPNPWLLAVRVGCWVCRCASALCAAAGRQPASLRASVEGGGSLL